MNTILSDKIKFLIFWRIFVNVFLELCLILLYNESKHCLIFLKSFIPKSPGGLCFWSTAFGMSFFLSFCYANKTTSAFWPCLRNLDTFQNNFWIRNFLFKSKDLCILMMVYRFHFLISIKWQLHRETPHQFLKKFSDFWLMLTTFCNVKCVLNHLIQKNVHQNCCPVVTISAKIVFLIFVAINRLVFFFWNKKITSLLFSIVFWILFVVQHVDNNLIPKQQSKRQQIMIYAVSFFF